MSKHLMVGGIQSSTVEGLADALVREVMAATPPVQPSGYFARPLSADELVGLCRLIMARVPDAGNGVDLIAAERVHQHQRWGDAHDDAHENGELVSAAVWYADNGCDYDLGLSLPPWPFEPEAWKASDDQIRQLAKAGALIAAEIDRLQRRAEATPDTGKDIAAAAARTLEVLNDDEEMAALRAGLEDVKAGRVTSLDSIRAAGKDGGA